MSQKLGPGSPPHLFKELPARAVLPKPQVPQRRNSVDIYNVPLEVSHKSTLANAMPRTLIFNQDMYASLAAFRSSSPFSRPATPAAKPSSRPRTPIERCASPIKEVKKFTFKSI